MVRKWVMLTGLSIAILHAYTSSAFTQEPMEHAPADAPGWVTLFVPIVLLGCACFFVLAVAIGVLLLVKLSAKKRRRTDD